VAVGRPDAKTEYFPLVDLPSRIHILGFQRRQIMLFAVAGGFGFGAFLRQGWNYCEDLRVRITGSRHFVAFEVYA
jgi:hypothetical protein